ncbi:hypothetical protein ACIP98_25380 [Streptomyces sp. NPDC088354]|uniref:hypothetical protein n=1 Tax=Streptomyces sp. NPDC088354 TaxID=3365856 RepID=UPI00382D1AD6
MSRPSQERWHGESAALAAPVAGEPWGDPPPPAPAEPAGRKGGAPRKHGPADPVRELMHRHQRLCAEAVDPLEIVAGLEAQGVTDRVAGSFRHRDVFSLAEELYARVPRAGVPEPAAEAPTRPPVLLTLAPGLVCAAATWALQAVHSLAVAAVAGPLLLAALFAALRTGPLRAPYGNGAGGTLWACWLLGFAAFAEGVRQPAAGAVTTALALSLAPAAWCAHRFAVRARGHLLRSRSLEEFGAAVRPLLLGTLALYLVAVTALLCAARAVVGAAFTPAALVGPAALALLLFTGRLLAIHGYPDAGAVGTGLASATEAVCLAAVLLGRLSLDPGSVAAVACAAAAPVLVAYALSALSRASAHTFAAVPAMTRPAPRGTKKQSRSN